MKTRLPWDVSAAIEDAKRTRGWNNRRPEVQKFILDNMYGHERCRLYVVPAAKWAYRRLERRHDAANGHGSDEAKK